MVLSAEDAVIVAEILKWIGRSAASIEEAERVGHIRQVVSSLLKDSEKKLWVSGEKS